MDLSESHLVVGNIVGNILVIFPVRLGGTRVPELLYASRNVTSEEIHLSVTTGSLKWAGMSYDLELFRRQHGRELDEMVTDLEKLQNGEADDPSIEKSFLLNKALIARELLDSPLLLGTEKDFDGEETGEDIVLSSLVGTEPPVEFLCSDYSIGVSIGYGSQAGQWLEGLTSLWAVVLNICERNHLVFYDAELDCEASMESFERTVLHFTPESAN